jgi:hypothetical protein
MGWAGCFGEGGEVVSVSLFNFENQRIAELEKWVNTFRLEKQAMETKIFWQEKVIYALLNRLGIKAVAVLGKNSIQLKDKKASASFECKHENCPYPYVEDRSAKVGLFCGCSCHRYPAHRRHLWNQKK